MANLWESSSTADWKTALESYESVVARQGSERLPGLDRWYRLELPGAIRGRERPHITADELQRLTQWKMARGVWRARNLALVRENDPDEVLKVSERALASSPDPKAPIALLSKLGGVGPATASAVAAAYSPEVYPFFDELVAAQVPGLGKVEFTLGYYLRYAESIRRRAAELSHDWTPASVERALWAHLGGKAGTNP